MKPRRRNEPLYKLNDLNWPKSSVMPPAQAIYPHMLMLGINPESTCTVVQCGGVVA